jgi:hypothetical protein
MIFKNKNVLKVIHKCVINITLNLDMWPKMENELKKSWGKGVNIVLQLMPTTIVFHTRKSNDIKPLKWHIASKPKCYSFTTNRNSL